MTNQEMRDKIAASIRARTGGDEDSDETGASPSNRGWNMPVAPPKPDPEAAASSQVMGAAGTNTRPVQQGSVPVVNPQADAARQALLRQIVMGNGQQATNSPQMTPQQAYQAQQDPNAMSDQARQQMNQFKMDYLKRQAQGGGQ